MQANNYLLYLSIYICTNAGRLTLAENTPMLKIENVHKHFRGLHAINDVSLVLTKGKIWSLIGPNGAGKTTLFNLITGALSADEGKIEFEGIDITNKRSFEICRMGIVRTYQLRNVFLNLSVYENIAAGTMKDQIDEATEKKRIQELIDFLELTRYQAQIVANLPPLQSKMVELGRSLATSPRIILLDELIGGLLPSETKHICEIIKKLKDRGFTIFQIGHEIGPIMEISDWVFVLDEGRKIAEGTPEEVRNNREVQNVYLE